MGPPLFYWRKRSSGAMRKARAKPAFNSADCGCKPNKGEIGEIDIEFGLGMGLSANDRGSARDRRALRSMNCASDLNHQPRMGQRIAFFTWFAHHQRRSRMGAQCGRM